MILIMAPVNISSSTIIPAWEGGRQRAPSIPWKRRRTGKNISVVQIFSKMKSLYLVLDSLSFGFIIEHYSSFIMGWLMLIHFITIYITFITIVLEQPQILPESLLLLNYTGLIFFPSLLRKMKKINKQKNKDFSL